MTKEHSRIVVSVSIPIISVDTFSQSIHSFTSLVIYQFFLVCNFISIFIYNFRSISYFTVIHIVSYRNLTLTSKFQLPSGSNIRSCQPVFSERSFDTRVTKDTHRLERPIHCSHYPHVLNKLSLVTVSQVSTVTIILMSMKQRVSLYR